MNEAELILLAVKIWAGVGACVTVAFLTFGIDRIDEDADGAFVFRPLIVPGIILIWPLVLWRWSALARGHEDWSARHHPHRRSHHWIALAMPIAIVAIIGAGLSVRQTWPGDIAPTRLAAPAEASQ